MLGRDTFVASHVPEDHGDEPMIELGLFELVDAFQRILERTKLDLSHEVSFERITVSERIGEIVELIAPGELIPFESLIGEETTKMRLVVTLLALLEMTRLRMTRLLQEGKGTQIFIVLRGPGEVEQARTRHQDSRARSVQRLGGVGPLRRKPLLRTLRILARCRRLPRRRSKVLERWNHRTKTRGRSLRTLRKARSRSRWR